MVLTETFRLVTVGLISGMFSAFLAYRGHQQKRVWELRVNAYQELIYALSDLHYYYYEYLKSEERHGEPSDERCAELSAVWDSGFPKVRRSADAGAFLFSEPVQKALSDFRESQKGDWEGSYQHYFDGLEGVGRCLKSVVEASKTDLKLKWGWLR